MITIIHGEDTEASNKTLIELLKTCHNIVWLDGVNISYQSLLLELESQSLFMDEKTIVILNPSKIKKAEQKKVFEELAKYADSISIQIYIYSENVVSQTLQKNFSKAKSYLYELPKYYFLLLDNLKPKNFKVIKKNLDKTLERYTPEQIFYSLIKRIRLLLLIKDNGLSKVSEGKALSSWQEGRLKQQADAWNKSALLNLYQEMFEIEKNLKSGGLPMELSHHIDMTIALGVN